jgi:DnaK suppressor protein
MLTQKQIDQLSALMAELEARLRAEVRAALRARIQRADTPQGVGGEDRADQSTADLEDGIDTGMLTRDVEELYAIIAARKRLAAGKYGECRDCAVPIDFTRLIALPAAERCLACEDRRERRGATSARASL